MWFYGAIEQLLSGWVFELIPAADDGLRARPGDGRRDDLRRARGAGSGERAGARVGLPDVGVTRHHPALRTASCTGAAKLLNVVVGI